MKRIITAICILVFLTTACFGSYAYIDTATSAVSDTLEQARQALLDGAPDAAHERMEQGYALWQTHYARLSALVRHNEIDDAERLFQRARQAAESGNAAETLLQLRELCALLHHLPEMEKPTYANLI